MKKILPKALIIILFLLIFILNINTINISNNLEVTKPQNSKNLKKYKWTKKSNTKESKNSYTNDSIVVDSKLKMSHSKWLSDKFLKNELKSFIEYNNLYKKWINTPDGKVALQKAYELSGNKQKEFNIRFNNWKKQHSPERDIAEFRAKMNKRDSDAYQIYKKWATTNDGQEKIKTIFNNDQDTFDEKFKKFKQIASYWKTSEEYINLDDSLNTYKNWKKSPAGIEVLKPLFKNSGNDYINAYNFWKIRNYKSISQYIADLKSQDNFDTWRLTDDGKEALKTLYKKAGRQDKIYQARFSAWRKDQNNWITPEQYYDDLHLSSQSFKTWRESQDGQEALKKDYKLSRPDYLNNLQQWINDNIMSPIDVIDNSKPNDDVDLSFNQWINTDDGKNALKIIFEKSGQDFVDYAHNWKLKPKNLKTEREYAKDVDSIDDFNNWKTTLEGKVALKTSFENSGRQAYERAYDTWKKLQPIKSPEDFWNDDVSKPLFNNWLKTDDGRSAILRWTIKSGKNRSWVYWEWKKLEANNKKDISDFKTKFVFTDLSNGNIGEYAEKFAQYAITQKTLSWRIKQSFIRAILLSNVDGNKQAQAAYKKWFKTNRKTAWDYLGKNASNQNFYNWIKTQDGRNALILIFVDISSEVDRAYNLWKIKPGNKNKTKEEFKNSGWENIGEYAESWAKSTWNSKTNSNSKKKTPKRAIQHAFVDALYKTRGQGDQVLKNKYHQWKYKTKDQYKATIEFQNDALAWAQDKRTDENYDVIDKFVVAIKSIPSSANNNYDLWRKLPKNLKSDKAYKQDDEFKDDVTRWADGKMKSNLQVKNAFAKAMSSTNKIKGISLKAKYNKWKYKSEADYEADKAFKIDLSKWADNNKENNNIKTKFVQAITTSTKTNGDDVLKASYESKKYRLQDEYEISNTFKKDAGKYWAANKLKSNDEVKTKFIRAITTSKQTNGDQVAKKKFDSWKIKDPSVYQQTPQFKLDVSTWAIGKRKNATKAEFKKALDGTINYRSGGHKVAKDKFDIWKRPNADFYKNNQIEYVKDIKWYINNKNDRAVIQKAVEKVINLPSPAIPNNPKKGNDILKDEFMLWKILSKENFLKTYTNKNAYLKWGNKIPSNYVFIRKVISDILNDKKLSSKKTGNSEFIDNLKKISQRSYQEYLAKN